MSPIVPPFADLTAQRRAALATATPALRLAGLQHLLRQAEDLFEQTKRARQQVKEELCAVLRASGFVPGAAIRHRLTGRLGRVNWVDATMAYTVSGAFYDTVGGKASTSPALMIELGRMCGPDYAHYAFEDFDVLPA